MTGDSGIRPNVLFIIADQFRASCLGSLGQDPTFTPALDRLALGGRVFTNAVSNYPVCSPARAMLLTGQYPWSNGVPFNVNSQTAERGVALHHDARCWSDVLADEGYRLGYIGKWHLTAPTAEDEVHGEGRRDDGKVWDAWTPPEERHGFSFWYSHGCCDQHLEPHYWTTEAARDAPRTVHQWSAEHETDVAIDFLREASQRGGAAEPPSQPFGLMLSYNPPHQPFDELPPGYLDRYAAMSPHELLNRPNVDLTSEVGQESVAIARQYFAAVTAVDEQIGRLLDELDQLGVTDNTVVIFTSDHGMQLGSHDLMYKSVPFDESARVPFVVRWPGHVPPRSDDLPLGSVDVAPTLLGLLGLAEKIPTSVEGTDCSRAVLGQEGPALQDSTLHFGPTPWPGHVDTRGLRSRTHKLVVDRQPDSDVQVRLVDLRVDPFELDDVSAEQPETVAAMQAELGELLERCGDPWSRIGPITPTVTERHGTLGVGVVAPVRMPGEWTRGSRRFP